MHGRLFSMRTSPFPLNSHKELKTFVNDFDPLKVKNDKQPINTTLRFISLDSYSW